MQLSTRGRYAVMAMVDLATRQSLGCECGPVCLAEIAASQNLSLSYLEQLFGKLRKAGLVVSARGPGGGYRLARESDRIAVAAIIAGVDEPIRATRCDEASGSCLALPGQTGERCQTHDLWAELGRQIGLFLDGVTLADVVLGRVRGRAMPPIGGFRQAGGGQVGEARAGGAQSGGAQSGGAHTAGTQSSTIQTGAIRSGARADDPLAVG